jgi:hypothetical protein
MRMLTRRLAATVGASLLAALAGLAFTTTPASAAAGVDLGVALSAGKVAAGSAGKPFLAKVTNAGDANANGFTLKIQFVSSGSAAVSVELPDDLDEFCDPDGPGRAVCEFGNVLVPGDSLEIPILVAPASDETGKAGSLHVVVLNDEDGNKDNNKASTNIIVTPAGVDIVVWAQDVVAGYDDETGEVQRIAPGGTGKLVFGLANGGSVTALGIEFTLQLPEHVTFEETLEGCNVSSDKRTLSCSGPDVELPADQFFEWTLTVKIAASAPGSSVLTGSIEGRALGVLDEAPALAARAQAKNVSAFSATARNNFDQTEVDNRDNTDAFAVFVGAASGGGGGLPVTGPKAMVIGMVGVGAVAIGVVALVGARRRRIVLVTPAE